MGLTLGILEGQNFARKNHHGVGPRRAGAAELAAVAALDSDGQFAPTWRAFGGGVVCPNYLVTFVASSLTIGFDAFIVDLMSQSRDFAPMGDDEAAKGTGVDGEVEFSLHQASKPCLRRDRSGDGVRLPGVSYHSAQHRGSQRVGRPSRFTTRASPGMITTASS
jgi:hypothetical protein